MKKFLVTSDNEVYIDIHLDTQTCLLLASYASSRFLSKDIVKWGNGSSPGDVLVLNRGRKVYCIEAGRENITDMK